MIDTNDGVEMTSAATCPGVMAADTSTTTSLVMPTESGTIGSAIELGHRVRVRDVPATVDDQHLPVDVRREIARDEQQWARDVEGHRHAARRDYLRGHRSRFGAQHLEHPWRQRAAGS